ncbi:helix-turn-helix domain-containing protein [Rhodococcus gordoniae]|uniref:helix-turn-helix domain-containing protein n=1 Tax=Rhodococcus gordoniae TaxID=223392 RepID=UPI001FEBB40B|nr:helix-turn-helix domain-containing protein [Rhodococcus gordoniae]
MHRARSPHHGPTGPPTTEQGKTRPCPAVTAPGHQGETAHENATAPKTHVTTITENRADAETAHENATAPKTHVTTITENRADAETASETPVARSTRTATADPLARQLEVPLPHLPGTHLDTNAIPAFHSHEERREWALARRQAGVEVPVIAQEVDRSVATVYRWLSEADTSVTI